MEPTTLDVRLKIAVYAHFAETGGAPTLAEIADVVFLDADTIRAAYRRLREARVLVLEPDGVTIRMAPPFSGVPTQHVVESAGVRYFANCAWDSLGIVAALRREGVVRSRCEHSLEPLCLRVRSTGPEPSTWLFHCVVPAAHWWDDIVFT